MRSDRSGILTTVCEHLTAGDPAAASRLIRSEYPFEPVAAVERKYGEEEALSVFMRDGFVDRYSGDRLVFPGALRLLSLALPSDFPFHPNWKMSETHEAFWELSPTVDHIIPVSRGGLDEEANWVTTSMRRNSAKSNWTLEQLGWTLHPRGDMKHWDGLLGWFTRYVSENQLHLENGLVRKWHRAARDSPAP